MGCPRLHEIPAPPAGRDGWPWAVETLPKLKPTDHPWPKITVVTPSYNQASFLEETLRSVLLQGYPNLEYIVMDGGSTDGSVEIIERYRPWLAHVHIGPDGGQAAAIAAGFNQASGDILAWLNSDDRYQPGALLRAGRFMARNSALVFINSDVNHILADGALRHRYYVAAPSQMVAANLGRHMLVQQGCFWRREAYERVGGVDPSLRFCMDRDLFIRLMGSGSVGRMPGPPTADFREHEAAKSSTILDVAARESGMLIERYGHPLLRRAPGLLRRYWRVYRWPSRTRRWLHQRFGFELA
ncbi:glycosyltransferase [Chloroflexales bacterium ZM16-3]|nr:glycosyltransferase [Chloroflexales bacterium ZM16-3]